MDTPLDLHGHPFFDPFHLVGFGFGNTGSPQEPSPARAEAGRLLAALGRRSPTLRFDGTLADLRSFAACEGFALRAAAHSSCDRWVVLLESGGFVVALPTPEGPRFVPTTATIGSTEGLDLPRFLQAVDRHMDGLGFATMARLPWRLAPPVLDAPRANGEIVPGWWPVSGLTEGVLDALALLLAGRPGLPCAVLESIGPPEEVCLTVQPAVPYGAALGFTARLFFHNARRGIVRRPPRFGESPGDQVVHALLRAHHLFHHVPQDGALDTPALVEKMPLALNGHQRLRGEKWLATHLPGLLASYLPGLLASLPPQGTPL